MFLALHGIEGVELTETRDLHSANGDFTWGKYENLLKM